MPDHSSSAPPRLPLAGVRVLDLTRILAGPWATQNLADLGAEVIKIENPNGGDDTRQMGPPFVRDQHSGENCDAAYFLAANRGKESVAIDIATPRGQELVRALAAKCDVLVENFKVGGLARYGLDYASLHKALPQLIYCSITGFGQTGPYRQRAGYDYLIQGSGPAWRWPTSSPACTRPLASLPRCVTGMQVAAASTWTSACSTSRWRYWPTSP